MRLDLLNILAREEIETLVNTMNGKGDKFSFDTDFVMRAALTLTDSPINLKIESFKKTNVLKISENWENIKTALLNMVEFLTKSGFSDESITSYNALILLPIIYIVVVLFQKRILPHLNIILLSHS